MPPRPIHKWKTLWLGILVLLFLGSAWVSSIHYLHIAGFIYPSKDQAIFLRNIPGALQIENTGPGHSLSPVTPPVQGYTYTRLHPPEWFPKPVLFEPFGNRGGWTVNLPHWIILPLYLIAFTTLLFWRRRRVKHWLEAQTPPPS